MMEIVMQSLFEKYFLELFIFQLGIIAALSRLIYNRLKKDIKEAKGHREKIDEEIVHLTEEVTKLNQEIQRLKITMYGHGDDDTNRGHIYETERRLDELGESITQLRQDMKEEHQETKNGLRSIMKYLYREDENFDPEEIFDS